MSTRAATQNIGTVWGQIRVSAINLDISADEFQQIVQRMARATEDLLGPESRSDRMSLMSLSRARDVDATSTNEGK